MTKKIYSIIIALLFLGCGDDFMFRRVVGSFDFESGVPIGWSTGGVSAYPSAAGTNIEYDYVNGPNDYGGSEPNRTHVYWAASAGASTPYIQTSALNVNKGGTINCYLCYGNGNAGAIQTETIDNGEGVYLEYSLDGTTWVEITYFGGGTFTDPLYGQWLYINENIPTGAYSKSTYFRFIQKVSSGSCCDNWGIDDIYITSN